ncbi:TPA: 30S ribosomal protein S19 [Candidatus Bathyarchaeota archaeon]|nr:30S ribosomal protein S19 [Candidatus Bathyarchaeota archaeon]
MPKEFTYRGIPFTELEKMPMDEFVKLLPSKARRKLLRGLPPEHRKLLERVREVKRAGLVEKVIIRTHCRDMVILPEMVGVTFGVHNGKEFTPVKVTSEMVGHRLGEFAITRKRVMHGAPGIGASRSSMYVPLK